MCVCVCVYMCVCVCIYIYKTIITMHGPMNVKFIASLIMACQTSVRVHALRSICAGYIGWKRKCSVL